MSEPAGYLGVDIGGTSIKWSVVRGGAATASGEIATPRGGHEPVLAAVRDLAAAAGPVAGMGVAVPGTVEPVQGRTVLVPNLPGQWRDLPVAALLEEATGHGVALINDARAFAWAERANGAAAGADDVLFITLGTGVGGAILRRGEVLVGALDAVGEMGHVPVDPAGARCGCGGRGCLETIASATAITGHLARTVALGQSRILDRLTRGGRDPLTAEAAAEAARLGDPWARDAFARAGEALGRAAATAVLLLRLELVVVGGGLRPAADLFLPQVERALAERESLTGRVEVRSARHGREAGSVGAAVFAAARAAADGLRTSAGEGAHA